jgi:hypothetical protein
MTKILDGSLSMTQDVEAGEIIAMNTVAAVSIICTGNAESILHEEQSSDEDSVSKVQV